MFLHIVGKKKKRHAYLGVKLFFLCSLRVYKKKTGIEEKKEDGGRLLSKKENKSRSRSKNKKKRERGRNEKCEEGSEL